MARYDGNVVASDPTEFRFDGGAVWLNFLATRGQSFSARPIERLPDPGRLATWLDRVELAPRAAPTADDLKDAHRLREALRALALAVLADTAPPADRLDQVRALVLAVPDAGGLPIAIDGALRRPAPADASAALARIAVQALDHLAGADRRQLRICAEHDCRCVFLDTSGRRRWCPSPACASRGRVRALRARRGPAPSEAPLS
jgi:predicted RNA-binding Zn ribbon-like protein